MEGKTSRFILIFLLVSFTSLVWAQTSLQKSEGKTAAKKRKPSSQGQKSAKEGAEKLWLERAESLTEEAREEEWRLRKQRPLLLARLAEAWWRVDIKKARPWMDAAVSELEGQPQNESVTDSVKRIHTAEVVLGIVVPLDRSYAERLLKTVTIGVERLADSVMSAEDRQEFGRLKLDLPRIAEAALRDKNFDSADRVFRTLLKLKDHGAAGILMRIRALDASHADMLYASALESARASYDSQLIFTLGQYVYPFSDRGADQLPSEALRKRFLGLFTEAVLRVPQTDQEQNQVCELSRGGERLIDNYPAEQGAAMRSVLDDCKRREPMTETEKRTPDKKLETMDDFLEAAKNDPDASQRGYYKSQAARKAEEAGQSLRAVEIIRSLAQEEREGYPVWASDHINYEQDAMRELYKSHDLPGLQKLMDNSPRRPQTLLSVSNMLFEEKDESFALLILSEARRAFEKTQADEPLTYLSLLGAYARYMPSETPAVLKEVVMGLNGIKPAVFAPDAKFKFWWGQFADDLRVWPMPNLLDVDPQYVSETIKLLDLAENRTVFRLSLLRNTLQRYQREKVKQQEKRQAAPANRRDNVAPTSN